MEQRSDQVVGALTDGVGLTASEAERFLMEAKSAVLESYAWQSHKLHDASHWSPAEVRDLLAGIRARALSRRLGLSSDRTWAGLRILVREIAYPTVEHEPRSRRHVPAYGRGDRGPGRAPNGYRRGGRRDGMDSVPPMLEGHLPGGYDVKH